MINEESLLMSEKHIHEHSHLCAHRQISWTAIFVGALVGVGLSFLLNLFSVAIGLSVVSTSNEGLISLAVGGFVGLLIGGIISMFLAGLTAGYLGRAFCPQRNLGILYGFTTWCLALLFAILLTSSIGRYISSYSKFISNPATIIVSSNESTSSAPETSQPNTTTNANLEKQTNTLGMGALIVFVLFFVGAVSTCFGAHYGMVGKERR